MQWWLGIDDTDTLDTPGTNKLALHLADVLAGNLTVQLIIRHQLFFDPRVPYTSHNGCVSMLIETRATIAAEIADLIRPVIVAWCPDGSDPGLCIASEVPNEVIDFGLRCQRDVVSQPEALEIARRNGVHLEGLGGTHDGVIGALAGVGLLATQNDGRIIHRGGCARNWSDIQGCESIEELLHCGVAFVERYDNQQRLEYGTVALRKRLRPNLRGGKAVLFVLPADQDTLYGATWQAVKVV